MKLRTYVTAILLIICLYQCTGTKTPEARSIQWLYSIDSARVAAQQQKKPIMIDFMAEWCPPCKAMEDSTFNQSGVIDKSQQFITLRIDVDKQPDVAIDYNGNARKYGGVGIPNLLFLSPDNEKIKHVIGYHNAEQLIAVMDSALQLYSEMQ
ncbi:MAG: thioredoxin family protein [Candidatus Marinimicrobia bacterium]|nr:thioredoxin family protein [Candidatus Neomarinimicrobiota bacterium]